MNQASAEPVVTTRGAAPPPAQGAAPPAVSEPLRFRLAGWLRARGVRSNALTGFAAAFSATAAFLLLVGHPGFGGLIGLAALVASELALVPGPAETRETTDLARALSPFVDLVITAGVFGGIVHREAAPMVALTFLVVVVLAWLPRLRAAAGPARLPATAGLWRRPERMGVLLVGVLLGRPAPALLMLLVVCGLDAWLRLERLSNPLGFQPQFGPSWVQRTIRSDGSLDPVARWVLLGLTMLAILVLPLSPFWRI